jgi:L,D-peptidoglycan transpeptidase YkuD (ErfK/YbiS/YcfS/YnhG family)
VNLKTGGHRSMTLRSRCNLSFICFFLLLIILGAGKSLAIQESPMLFKDLTPQHWAYNTVAWAISKKITFGYEDGTFRPDEKATEAQFIAFLVRGFGDIPDLTADSKNHLTSWSDKYYNYLINLNYPITRNQHSFTRRAAADILSSTQGVNYSERFAIQYLINHGLVNGETSATIEGFKGKDDLTRAEALQLIKNVLDKAANKTLQIRPQNPGDTTILNVPKIPIEQLHSLGSAEQAILVTAPSYGDTSVKIETFEKINGLWYEKFAPLKGVIGELGFTPKMTEGNKQSPEGVFTLGSAFGKYANPGTALPYQQVNADDYWVDDPESRLYNTWQTGPVNGRWTSAEHLLRSDGAYDYAVVIDFNTDRIPGDGSAIFLHVWLPQDNSTLGCTALSESDLLEIMKWLDPSKHPIIIQGTADFVSKL